MREALRGTPGCIEIQGIEPSRSEYNYSDAGSLLPPKPSQLPGHSAVSRKPPLPASTTTDSIEARLTTVGIVMPHVHARTVGADDNIVPISRPGNFAWPSISSVRGKKPSSEELRDWTREALGRYKAPQYVFEFGKGGVNREIPVTW
ncbi:hypothetical protein ETB97_000201 [Aspergillus alliaceus]|uniref:Uncharacterized protein n=1 Tax=Petromyces alliaceus TaxID=209559 RepID=A0A8H6EB54_PETAA|nr:hypothetical protein ETB97_000201 [Aspergillus burnettii]